MSDEAESDDQYAQYWSQKQAGLEAVLGPMHNIVGHAIIPFSVGGPLDMYRFAKSVPGTCFASMELIEPDGSGPLPTVIGTYEVVAFTKHTIEDAQAMMAFSAAELHIRDIMTSVARYSYEAELNPGDTCEVPGDREADPNTCLVLDEWRPAGKVFRIGGRRHGLLLCIEVFRSEMEYAIEHGSAELIDRLKASGIYPYSDLDRKPVA